MGEELTEHHTLIYLNIYVIFMSVITTLRNVFLSKLFEEPFILLVCVSLPVQ